MLTTIPPLLHVVSLVEILYRILQDFLGSYTILQDPTGPCKFTQDPIQDPKCVVPEIIHTTPTEGHWKFLGGGGI